VETDEIEEEEAVEREGTVGKGQGRFGKER